MKLIEAACRDTQLWRLARGLTGVLGLKVFAGGLGLLSGILVARFLGPAELGVLAYASSWGAVLTVLSAVGFSQLLVREITIYRSRKEWAFAAGIIRYCTRISFTTAVALCSAAALLIWALPADPETPSLRLTLWIILLTIPIGILVQIRQSVMRGFDQPTLAILPEQGVMPPLSVLLLIAGYFIFEQQLTAPRVAFIGLIGSVIVYSVGVHLLKRKTPAEVKTAEPRSLGVTWLKMVSPLYLISIIQFTNLQADILMLGYLSSPQEVGFYAVARSLTGLIVFVMVAAEMIVAPMIADLYADRQTKELQKLIRKSAQLIAITSIPVALTFLTWGNWFLSLYGPEFISGLMALQILCAGQLINALSGPIGQVAIHTGHDRVTTYVVAVAASANILLNWLLIPGYGAAGAATATIISLIIWNIGLLAYIYLKTGLSAIALPVPSRITGR